MLLMHNRCLVFPFGSPISHCITDSIINFQSAGKVQKNDKDLVTEKAITGIGATPTTGMFLNYHICVGLVTMLSDW